MEFSPDVYGPAVASLLKPGAAPLIANHKAEDLFRGSLSPQGALSGLWLYHGRLDESHSISQDLPTAEGSFWHGILHRREPDPGNAAYWFRRVGRHAVFPAIREAVGTLLERRPGSGFRLKPEWDPFAWIDFWEQARRAPGSAAEQTALEIQRVEWEILFDWCARPRS